MGNKGRVVILRTETTISPFGDHVSESFFTDETLAQTQDRAFIGFEIVRVATPQEAVRAIRSATTRVVLLLDRVYLSEKAAADFLLAADKATKPAILTLEINASVRYTLPLQDIVNEGSQVVHDVLLLEANTELPEDERDPVRFIRRLGERANRVLVPKREIVVEVPLPTIGEGGKQIMSYPVTSTIVVSLEHWVHILWLNQIAFGIRWMELLRRHPFWTAARVLSGFSFSRHALLDRFVWRGRETELHPTSYLSASILGRNVKVGAHATIRNSIVGDGGVIGDHAVLLNSVVGRDTFIMENTFMVSTVCLPRSTVGNYKLQVSLIGQDAYVNAWAGFVDAKFAGHVMVSLGDKLASSGTAFLGSVVGHRARVASKVLIQPGREIPNDTLIVMRPDEVVSHVPADLPPNVPMVRDRGTLVPLGKETLAR